MLVEFVEFRQVDNNNYNIISSFHQVFFTKFEKYMKKKRMKIMMSIIEALVSEEIITFT